MGSNPTTSVIIMYTALVISFLVFMFVLLVLPDIILAKWTKEFDENEEVIK